MAENKRASGGPLLPEQFFDFYSPQEAKEMLWKWFSATVTDGFSKLSPIEKENIISLYERLNQLLDGVHGSVKPKPENHE